MSFLVTRATRADIPACIRLNQTSMPENYLPMFWTTHYNQFGDMFFVAKVDGELIGYVMCREEVVNGIRTGLVVSIAVDSRYRKLGVGQELMKNAHYAMRERRMKVAALQVRQSNVSAIALYQGMGYANSHTIHDYYNHPSEDAYLMTYVL